MADYENFIKEFSSVLSQSESLIDIETVIDVYSGIIINPKYFILNKEQDYLLKYSKIRNKKSLSSKIDDSDFFELFILSCLSRTFLYQPLYKYPSQFIILINVIDFMQIETDKLIEHMKTHHIVINNFELVVINLRSKDTLITFLLHFDLFGKLINYKILTTDDKKKLSFHFYQSFLSTFGISVDLKSYTFNNNTEEEIIKEIDTCSIEKTYWYNPQVKHKYNGDLKKFIIYEGINYNVIPTKSYFTDGFILDYDKVLEYIKKQDITIKQKKPIINSALISNKNLSLFLNFININIKDLK